VIRARAQLVAVRSALIVSAALAAALAATTLSVVTAPTSVGAPVSITPNVATLPAGALPRLPYVHWGTKTIVDGNRRVSIAGIQSRVISLHKVDGGYILGREGANTHDLVFVTYTGARRVLVANWLQPRADSLDANLAVRRYGDRLIANTLTGTGMSRAYRDTRVVALPSGQVLRTKDFGHYAPSLHGYGIDRAMLTVGGPDNEPPENFLPNVRWWNPVADEVTTLLENASVESADLSAWQWAYRPQSPQGSGYAVSAIPPHTTSKWSPDEEDVRLGPWSNNDAFVAGNNEVTDDHIEASSYQVHRTSDGRVVFGVQGNHPPQLTWETDTALLLRTRVGETMRYQLIRCNLTGSCSRVGPSTTDRRGVIIPAHRRNS
jgi:hypothetical protein